MPTLVQKGCDEGDLGGEKGQVGRNYGEVGWVSGLVEKGHVEVARRVRGWAGWGGVGRNNLLMVCRGGARLLMVC